MTTDDESFVKLVDIVRHLRAPNGCPWDQEQTHISLKRNLLEECYEALEAIDEGDPGKLSEELGDILVQIVFHSQIADEDGRFNIDDVVSKINEKLVRRHPHVFGDITVADVREVELNWEILKAEEGKRKSPVEGIPKNMPALASAQLLQDRVSKAGFEWDDVSGVLDKLVEEIQEVRDAPTDEERANEVGDLLFSVVNLARWMDIHAEDSLRRTISRFSIRYLTMEKLAADRGRNFAQLSLDQKEGLWQEAKGIVG